MAEVKVLVEGYTNADSADDSGEEHTCPTMTLIKDNDLVIVVDPGVISDKQILIDALKNEGLDICDVNVVFLTHSHIDHYRNVGMFPNAKVLEYYGIWDKDMVEEWKEQFTDSIKIIKTPGHLDNSLTLLVKTKEGVVAIVGDVFWKENFPEVDAYASDLEKLKESRALVLAKADFIVPGHGAMFKVKI